jgi:Haem-NO-binding
MAGQKDACYMHMAAYDDQITYDLVECASKVLSLTSDQVLEAYGEYWVEYAGKTAYTHLMQAAGCDLRTFLSKLNDLHLKVSFTMPHLRPPTFVCEEIDQWTLRLQYHSVREGLAPMIAGLIRGLGNRFDQKAEVEQTAWRKDVGYDEFLIRIL